MSNLQIALILIGTLFVAGIVLFNWMQQRSHRRKAEALFQARHDDVLLEGLDQARGDDGRIEHQLIDLDDDIPDDLPVLTEEAETEPAAESKPAMHFADSEIDYIAEMQAASPIGAEEIAEVFRRKHEFGKFVGVYGLNIESGTWEEPHARPKYRNFKISLQLVDRSGVASLAKLAEFRDMVVGLAAQLKATEHCPEINEAHARAIQLDRFCAEVDMLIGINVMSRGEETFAGTKIRGLAEAAGFRLESDGTFKYFDDQGTHLFSLCNHEPAVFLPDGIRHLSTHGITFLLDVPRVAQGKQAFDQMITIAKSFSGTLGGVLVDDKRLMLSEAGFDKIRRLLQEIKLKMESRQIAPGGERALRLFS